MAPLTIEEMRRRIDSEPGFLEELAARLRGPEKADTALAIASAAEAHAQKLAACRPLMAALVAALGSDDAAVARPASTALARMAVNDPVAAPQRAADAGALPALLAAAARSQSGGDDATLAEALQALGDITYRVRSPLAALLAVTPGAQRLLVDCLTSGRAAATVAAVPLQNICHVDWEHAQRVANEPGAMAGLVAALRSPRVGAAGAAACALSCMAGVGQSFNQAAWPAEATAIARRIGAEVDALPALASLLRLRGEGTSPVVNAAGVVAAIAAVDAGHAQRVAREPGLLAGLQALLGHEKPNAAYNAAFALFRIAFTGAAHAVAAADGAIDALAAAALGGAAAAQAHKALATIACDPRAARGIAQSPGTVGALAAAQGSASYAGFTLSRAVRAGGAEAAGRVLAARGALASLTAALRVPGQVGVSALMLADAIAESGPGPARRLADGGVVPPLAAALRSADSEILAGSVRTLLSIANADKALATRVAEEGGVAEGLAAAIDGPCHNAAVNAACLVGSASNASGAAARRLARTPSLMAAAARAACTARFPAAFLSLQAALTAMAGAGAAAEVAAALTFFRREAAKDDGPGMARACQLLSSPPLSLPAEPVAVLARSADAAAALEARAVALEALARAAAGEALARPAACAACGQVAGGGVKLAACAGCAGGPAGRVAYCGGDCQRAARPAHRPYCQAVAAARSAGLVPPRHRP
ncbi:hypothetical protein Rsub_09015 [Raphidocelis subcapitata]|uniref:MYND-type domain-containing protein n=1 Tax=Raphidocelis subcapitata TaxID=307507 RepID=A0A2V0PIP9_9CHLO|nr:hypothetical protein Rsub_09015 [Raphidocelis subcapitata]|eukprot:GBF96935.1 hypothetical protein Rsub_09015 [Raphidocelis subcapitata]